MRKKTVLCFGDSNTYGYDPVGDTRYDAEHRWPAVMQNELGDGYEVISEGLSGRTTVFSDDIYRFIRGNEYLVPCLLSHGPVDLLIIMLGTNDCSVQNITPEKIAEGVGFLVETALGLPIWPGRPQFSDLESGFAKQVLIAVPAYIGVSEQEIETYGESAVKIAEISRGLPPLYRELADKYRQDFFNVNDHVKVCDFDKLHLSADSNVALGRAYADKLKNMMPE